MKSVQQVSNKDGAGESCGKDFEKQKVEDDQIVFCHGHGHSHGHSHGHRYESGHGSSYGHGLKVP